MALSVRTVVSFSALCLLVHAAVVGCGDDASSDNAGQGGAEAGGGVAGSTARGGASANGGATIVHSTQAGSPAIGGAPNPSTSTGGASTAGGGTATSGGSASGGANLTGGTSNVIGTAGATNAGGTVASSAPVGAGAGGVGTTTSTQPTAGTSSVVECNTLDYSVVSPITATRIAQNSPTPSGGAIVDGVYHQIADRTYTGPNGASGQTGTGFRSIVVISANTFNQAGSDGTRVARWTATFVAASPNLAVHHTCGRGAGEDEALSYSVVGNQLLIYLPSEEGVEEVVFARQ